MFDQETIPHGLDAMQPGPALAGFLASIDVTRLSGHDRIVVLRAHQRMASHYQAHVYGDMASVAHFLGDELDHDEELARGAAAAEIRAALRLTRRAADSELALARDLKERLPRLWNALEAGTVDVRRARNIAHGTAHLTDQTARRVTDRVLESAPHLTTGQLAARIRRLCSRPTPRKQQNAISTPSATGE